jgi:Mu-like prophage I protein
MDKFKKIDKEFCLTDNSVNVYGYRLLTEGLQLDQYKKNPIGFMMHDREGGVIVKWEDFRTEGDKLFGKPVINLSHPKGEDIAAQVENGFINAASMGKIICLAASDDKKLKLSGQTGPTVTKWFPREISFVDIPGNHNALANLYDIDDNELNLADFVKTNTKNTMSKALVTAAMLTAMNLSDNANEEDIAQKFQDLVDTAAKVPGLEQDLSDVKGKLSEKDTELKDLKAATTTKAVADLIAQGKTDKKLTNELATKLADQFASNPEGLKDLLDVMVVQTVVTENLGDNLKEGDYTGKTWDDLYAVEGEIEKVRKNFPDLYDKLKNEKFPNLKDS